MKKTLPKNASNRADFGDLRMAYSVVSEVFQAGGNIVKRGKTHAVTGLARTRAEDFERRMRKAPESVEALMLGLSEKKALGGREEIVLSVIARTSHSGDSIFDICALRVRARGPIMDAMVVSTSSDKWQDKLREFANWDEVAGVICAADGNNQRAAIGAVLTLARIGKGKLPIVEMEVPQEVDESTHLVRGAEWMKAGLPRFESSASEAIWYLLRARSLHSRMFRSRKQGFYTAMAFMAFSASGVSAADVSIAAGIPKGLVEKLGTPKDAKPMSVKDKNFINSIVFAGDNSPLSNADRLAAAERIWRGPGIYLRGMDWRLSVSIRARSALARGEDLVRISEDLRIQRRELVHILSQALSDGEAERDRFKNAIPKPSAFKTLVMGSIY